MIPPFTAGVTDSMVSSERLETRVLSVNDSSETTMLFLHGNLSNATWWETTLAALPVSIRGLAPDQRGYGDADASRRIDATKGMADLADDVVALLDSLGLARVTVVGNSLGGSVVWGLLARHPERLESAVLVNPGSPYGFGGIKGPSGEPNHPDFAGSGAGLINPDLVARLARRDDSADDPGSPRLVFRDLIVGGLVVDHEDEYLEGMFTVHLGREGYPGDSRPSANWPYVAPGIWGASNALSPKYTTDPQVILEHGHRPPITWIRGEIDLIVSDAGPLDPGVWGSSGVIPGYQGRDVYPPQPMVTQTRAFLDLYRESGGRCEEVVLTGCGHVPYLEQPEVFMSALLAHTRETNQ